MADTEKKDLRVREKQELTTPAEQTRPGMVFTPSVDIFETDRNITLLADLPGVKSDKLTIDLRDVEQSQAQALRERKTSQVAEPLLRSGSAECVHIHERSSAQ